MAYVGICFVQPFFDFIKVYVLSPPLYIWYETAAKGLMSSRLINKNSLELNG
jgi:hypothetical protein